MLEVKNIKKVYNLGDLKQVALNDVSIKFRNSEFVSILGPSGSGKSTLLNIIGGLDHYTEGDLIINNVSTKKYTSDDWDSYRNHRIGFVFQSYNLITHQSILANVELALTLSGVSSSERRKRALDALEKVGLKDHVKKKPSQLSGGQMQRVAIARALVNNPDIILADEPTGALDSETSVQIMNMLKEIANDKLVIMVTHNEDLAEEYSTRIVRLKDGMVTGDTNPYKPKQSDNDTLTSSEKKSSMGLLTALSLSLNNLLTKSGRTFLISFAGSIGIIGIALILSLSNGVNTYINNLERTSLSNSTITITKGRSVETYKIDEDAEKEGKKKCDKNSICTSNDFNSLTNVNNIGKIEDSTEYSLSKVKKEIDNNYRHIKDYTSIIKYNYDLNLQVYSKKDNSIVQVNPCDINISDDLFSSMSVSDRFYELIEDKKLRDSQYELLEGEMPNEKDELLLVVDKNNKIPLSLAYSLDIEDRTNLNSDDKKTKNYSYKSLIGKEFSLIVNTDYYVKEKNVWVDKSTDINYLGDLVDDSLKIKIVGIAKTKDDSTVESGAVAYSNKLTKYVINKIKDSDIAKDQLNNKDINIFTNSNFDGVTSTYIGNLEKLGIKDEDNPDSISIYPKNYESKDKIEKIFKKFNEEQKEKKYKITYSDLIKTLMGGISSIVSVISIVLIAFVAISLVVSSIMIAIITYISVLERTKEIGILRAIGASKKDVSRVFNAENLIEGFISGALGVIITFLLDILVNKIVVIFTEIDNIAILPIGGSAILILISILLSVIAGLIPSGIASRKDPVESLRSE